MGIILASTSVIRATLLKNAGVEFRIESSGVDEATIKSQLTLKPDRLALALAESKAMAVSRLRPSSLVIGADQVLSLEDTIFDKPKSVAEARRQLLALRGKTHILHSGIACAVDGSVVWRHCATAIMTMRQFSGEFMDRYVSGCSDDITSSVGAYKIEHRGLQLFDNIEGDYFTILGLPLLPLLKFLRTFAELPE